MLQRDFTFIVKENKYLVKIPTPRQIIQIETEKAVMTNGVYREILSSGTYGSSYSLDVVDMHSYFTVLIPDLLKDINSMGTTMLDMDLMDFNQLKEAYRIQFIPWVNSWMEMINSMPKEVKIDKKGEEEEVAENTPKVDQ